MDFLVAVVVGAIGRSRMLSFPKIISVCSGDEVRSGPCDFSAAVDRRRRPERGFDQHPGLVDQTTG